MRRGLGEERESIRRSRPLPNVTTSSLEALKLYAEADRLLTSDYDAAESYVAEALRVDTAFAMAHRLAGAITGSQLRVGEATYHLTRAWELRDRLTDRESRHVDALYHASVTLQPRQAATAYEMLLHRYPDDWRAANNLAGLAQAWLNDHDTARTLFLRATELNPNAPIAFQNAIPAAFLAGYLPQADSLAGVAADRGYAAIADRWLLVRAFATGDYSDAARRCDDVLTPPVRLPALAEELEFCGSVDIATGRLRRGVERLENVRRSHEAAGRTRNAAHAVQSIAVAHLLGNDDDAAARVIRAFVDGVTARDVAEPDRFITRINLQVQAALMDRPDLVRTIAEAYPPYPDAQHWFRRAGVGLVNAALSVGSGDPEAALRTLRSEWPAELDAIGWRIWLELISGIAHERAGRPDSAVVHYERAADPRYHALMTLTKNRIYLPITLQRLAAAHTMRGDPRAAVVAQRRLLELWSDADADLAPQMAALRDAVTAGTADHTAGANH